MSDTDFANMLNATLLKPGATMEAFRHMTGATIHRVIASFPLLDPYVQGIMLQSVINLSLPEFDAIQGGYSELIRLARQAEDEWVRRKAAEFQNFPQLTIDEEVTELDFPGVFDDQPMVVPAAAPADPEEMHFTWREDVKPPSSELPPPRMPQKTQQLPVQRPPPPARPLIAPPPVPPPRPPPWAPPEKDLKRSTKKKALSIEELQAERALDYRPDATKKK
jgi:hypothetical protein